MNLFNMGVRLVNLSRSNFVRQRGPMVRKSANLSTKSVPWKLRTAGGGGGGSGREDGGVKNSGGGEGRGGGGCRLETEGGGGWCHVHMTTWPLPWILTDRSEISLTCSPSTPQGSAIHLAITSRGTSTCPSRTRARVSARSRTATCTRSHEKTWLWSSSGTRRLDSRKTWNSRTTYEARRSRWAISTDQLAFPLTGSAVSSGIRCGEFGERSRTFLWRKPWFNSQLSNSCRGCLGGFECCIVVFSSLLPAAYFFPYPD